MPKDFAGRGGTNPRKRAKRKTSKRVSPKQRVLFHGPSFCAGALVGAAIVILAAYGPELFEVQVPAPAAEETAAEEPSIIFEFEETLKNMEVKPDPEPYAVPQQATEDISSTYSIQAASFRSRDDADALRARLILEGLPASTSAARKDDERWYRVIVGPFAKRVEAERAMTRLREQRLSAIWINNHN